MSYPHLISVIMPTYNRAEQVGKIIDKVIHQTYQNFELIIVNDGSKDNSLEVLENLAKKDSRIKVINKANGGVSSARNAGIENARGEFVVFVDDDDDISRNYLKSLMDVDLSIDLVIDSYSNQTDNGPIHQRNFPEIYKKGFSALLDTLFITLENCSYIFFPFAKRYRLSILKNQNIRFRNDITLGEDRPFVMEYLRYAKSMQVINSLSYIVKDDPTSEYRLSKGIKPADYLLQNFKESYSYLINYGVAYKNRYILKYADNYLAEKCIDYLLMPMTRNRYSKESENIIIGSLPRLWEHIKVGNVKNKRNRLIVRMIRSIGVRPVVYAMKIAVKAR